MGRCCGSVRILAFAGLFLLPTLRSLAIEQTGDLECRATGADGAPRAGVTLRLTGSNLQGERIGRTGPDGHFAFLAIPVGDYRLEASSPGFASSRVEEIRVHLGRTTSIVVPMRVLAVEETVEVTAERPLIDSARTTSLETYTDDFIARARVDSQARTYQSLFNSAAGVRASGTDSWVRGSSQIENTYLIDGVDTTDPTFGSWGVNVSAEALEEVQVQTGGFAAEFGRTTGGVLNLVTKSGGNQFSGSVDLRYRNEDLMSAGDHFDPDQNPVKQSYFDAAVGGPIVRDKLWFFVSAGAVRHDTPYATLPVSETEEGTRYLAKLTWQVTPSHKLTLQTIGDPTTTDNLAGPQAAPEAQATLDSEGRFTSLQYQGVLAPDFILQGQLAHFDLHHDLTPMSGDTATPAVQDFLTGAITVNYTDVALLSRVRDQANVTATWRVPGSGHTLRTGIDLQETSYRQNRLFTGNRLVWYAPDGGGASTPVLLVVQDPAGSVENSAALAAVFAQDDWRVSPKVTLQAGLRFDQVSFDDDTGRQIFTTDLLQPRLGVAVDATGDARNVFKVTASRYFYPGNLYTSEWANAHVDTRYVYANEELGGYLSGSGPVPVDLNGDGVIEPEAFLQVYGGPGGWAFANGGHLDAPRVDEYSVSYERRLTPASALGITLVRRTSSDLIEDRGDGSGMLWIDNVPGLVRRYFGAELRYQGQWKALSWIGSYTWTRDEGNAEQIATLGDSWDTPQTSQNRYGPLPGDLRNVVKVDGFWTMPKGFELGWAYRYRSAFPYTIYRPVAPYGSDYVGGRGAGRGPAFSQLDTSFKKYFTAGKTNLAAILSILNVLDQEAATEVARSESNAGTPLAYQLPRYFELGLRWTF